MCNARTSRVPDRIFEFVGTYTLYDLFGSVSSATATNKILEMRAEHGEHIRSCGLIFLLRMARFVHNSRAV